MRVSKYLKLDANILLEYVYDDTNLISEPYKIGVNIKNSNRNYISTDTTVTLNKSSNNLFPIDLVTNKYGIFDTNTYTFLQENDYASGFPLRHDTLNIYLPINWTFGDYQGFYLRAYGFDIFQKTTFDLTNFFFDITNFDQSSELTYINPPLYFQEKLWGKSISIQIPSLNAIANQTTNGVIKTNSVNYHLTNGVGLDTNTPLFIDFQFINNITTVNSVKTYTLSAKTTISVPQVPEFEKIGLTIEESVNGDFFEIYGTYNGTIGEFNDFMVRTVYLGNRYYVEYIITMYEQNIKGKTMKVTVNNDFLNKVEYRPIIKYSTTTAVIEVQMNLIDAVDNSQITRIASYGMLQDQVSKYSLKLMKINLDNANKPKIYNYKNVNTYVPANVSVSTALEAVKVPYPILSDKYNVVAKSDSVTFGKDTFFGIGKMMTVLYPFDNVLKIVVADQITSNQVQYLDMTNLGEIKLSIKNTNVSVDVPLYTESDSVNLSSGFLAFKIPSGRFSDIRKIYESGINVFYVTSTQLNTTTVIYSGLFTTYDSLDNVSNLNQQNTSAASSATITQIIPDTSIGGTVVVTRKVATQSTVILSTATSNGGTSLTIATSSTI